MLCVQNPDAEAAKKATNLKKKLKNILDYFNIIKPCL